MPFTNHRRHKKSGWRARLPTTCPHQSAPHLNGEQLKPIPLLRRKRAAAAAIARRIGILEDKSLAHERLFVLQRRAIQIQKTFRVHENARAVLLESFVAAPRLRTRAHRVKKAGAAATLHTDAQPADL